jgi:hypothetical protein
LHFYSCKKTKFLRGNLPGFFFNFRPNHVIPNNIRPNWYYTKLILDEITLYQFMLYQITFGRFIPIHIIRNHIIRNHFLRKNVVPEIDEKVGVFKHEIQLIYAQNAPYIHMYIGCQWGKKFRRKWVKIAKTSYTNIGLCM